MALSLAKFRKASPNPKPTKETLAPPAPPAGRPSMRETVPSARALVRTAARLPVALAGPGASITRVDIGNPIDVDQFDVLAAIAQSGQRLEAKATSTIVNSTPSVTVTAGTQGGSTTTGDFINVAAHAVEIRITTDDDEGFQDDAELTAAFTAFAMANGLLTCGNTGTAPAPQEDPGAIASAAKDLTITFDTSSKTAFMYLFFAEHPMEKTVPCPALLRTVGYADGALAGDEVRLAQKGVTFTGSNFTGASGSAAKLKAEVCSPTSPATERLKMVLVAGGYYKEI